MIINFVVAPVTPTYGFEGVTNQEFETWLSNVRGILSRAGFTQVGRAMESSDSEVVIWADKPKENFSIVCGATGVKLELVHPRDEAVEMTGDFHRLTQDADMFFPLEAEEKENLARQFNCL